MSKKKYYTITISQDINGASSFTKTINCPFVPKIVNVKNAIYANDGTEDGVSGIRSNIISTMNADTCICFIVDDTFSNNEMTFPVNKPINGQFEFKVVDQAGGQDTTRNGDLFMNLEFVG